MVIILIEKDTIKLLRECDSGIQMGIASIDDVWSYVNDFELKKALNRCKDEHNDLNNEIIMLLHEYHDKGKKPNFFITMMSKAKVKFKMFLNRSDETISSLMIEGCKMGIDSLNRYLNQYKAAEEKVKDITKRLIKVEEELIKDLKKFTKKRDV